MAGTGKTTFGFTDFSQALFQSIILYICYVMLSGGGCLKFLTITIHSEREKNKIGKKSWMKGVQNTLNVCVYNQTRWTTDESGRTIIFRECRKQTHIAGGESEREERWIDISHIYSTNKHVRSPFLCTIQPITQFNSNALYIFHRYLLKVHVYFMHPT